jgi:hypothetical protein
VTNEQKEKVLEFVANGIRSERIANQDINLGHFLSWESKEAAVTLVINKLRKDLETLE